MQYKYLIIGNGKVARHFHYYFDLLQIPYSTYHYREPQSKLNASLKESSHILVLIKDSVIDNFIEKYLPYNNPQFTILHFSGSLSSQYATAAHPLMTFANELYSLDKYLQIPFICEESGKPFNLLLPGLSNYHVFIPRSKMAYYHALCVVANNFTTILWQDVAKKMQINLNIEFDLLKPILQQTMGNISTHIQESLTGPFARNDLTTMENNLNALRQDDLQIIYNAFISYHELKNKKALNLNITNN